MHVLILMAAHQTGAGDRLFDPPAMTLIHSVSKSMCVCDRNVEGLAWQQGARRLTLSLTSSKSGRLAPRRVFFFLRSLYLPFLPFSLQVWLSSSFLLDVSFSLERDWGRDWSNKSSAPVRSRIQIPAEYKIKSPSYCPDSTLTAICNPHTNEALWIQLNKKRGFKTSTKSLE